MTENTPPRRVSEHAISIDLTNHLFPADENGQPLRIGMHGTEDQFIIAFSDRHKLLEFCDDFKLIFSSILKIENGLEFALSLAENKHIPFRIRLALDPYRYVTGSIRYREMILPGDDVPPFERESN